MTAKPYTAKRILREFYGAAVSTKSLAELQTVINGYAAHLDAWKAEGHHVPVKRGK